MADPIELYYWPTPNGWKVSICLEEMGLPYKVTLVNIGEGEQFDPGFLKISPNNRMPAITDPEGPDGKPISIFESGAILQYLARKTGSFCGPTQRERIAVDQWLMWQMGGLGPMSGQAHHFLGAAPAMDPPQDLPYAKDRYRNEVSRLHRVLDTQLAENEYVAGDFYSIADMAIWPWAMLYEKQEQDISDKPHFRRWLELVGSREAVKTGQQLHIDKRNSGPKTKDAQKILYGQKG